MPSYDQETWVQLLKSALLELEHSPMTGRIADAREEIVKRVAALRDIPGIHAIPSCRSNTIPSTTFEKLGTILEQFPDCRINYAIVGAKSRPAIDAKRGCE